MKPSDSSNSSALDRNIETIHSMRKRADQERNWDQNRTIRCRQTLRTTKPKKGRIYMGIIGTIVVGFLVGLVARFFKPGDDKMGFIVTTLVGIAGAFVGTYIGEAMGIYKVGEPAGFIGAVFGAILVLIVLRFITGRRS